MYGDVEDVTKCFQVATFQIHVFVKNCDVIVMPFAACFECLFHKHNTKLQADNIQ